MPASQAGRRGFDPRPPLHLFSGSPLSASVADQATICVDCFDLPLANVNETAASFVEALPAAIQPARVSTAPATQDAAAMRLRLSLLAELRRPASSLSTSGTGPDRMLPSRVSQPLFPDFNGLRARSDLISVRASATVSAHAAPMPSRPRASLEW